MAIQTTYSETIAAAVAGQVGDQTDYNIDTLVSEVAGGIGFGLVVGQGAADRGCVLGGALTVFRGISVRDVTLPDGQDDTYDEGDNVAVLSEGDIWVTVAAAVDAGDRVHYNATTGAISNTGGNGPIVGARFLTSAALNGLALVRLTAAQTGAA